VFLDLSDGDAFGRVNGEHLVDEVLRGAGEERGHGERSTLHLSEKLTYVVIIEWQFSREQCVQDNAATPNICHHSTVMFSSDNFWARIMWGAATCVQQRSSSHQGSHSEITNLQILVAI
jgi:hypothetical protein